MATDSQSDPYLTTDDCPSITTVIFDIGNVLIQWDVRALFSTVFADPDELDRFLSDGWTPADNDRCDRGEPFAVVIADAQARSPHWAGQIALAWDRWIEMVPGVVEGSFEIADELSDRRVRLLALSNFSTETFSLIRSTHRVFDHFDDIVLSGEHGVAKPDPEIFDLLCARNSVTPAECLFVDDVSINTAAASALGFDVVTFTDSASLRRDLVARHLLPSAQTH